ncbi:uncharacterized protein LOC122306512 isoform X1 [Carya illinoinensis]|uniref:uncharacterized protein LOC122306512 isoform X1 n=1 Tax=Carya illinoinensis TaxID=32201 RepID=UPI001C722D0C|nr:uncharacterized protein LOC122306512 isoform X1 [Carya illinoinensis]
MFLDSIIQRRLASLLQPWLREEPELEVKLGFINSQAVAKDLRFDTSVLNQLFDEPSRLSFKEVTVERLSFWFSNWYVPAFKIELKGIHVTLSPGEVMEEGRSRRVGEPKDTFSVAMKKTLSMLDPEGSALHDILERIFATKPSRNRFNTSFFILMLKYCQLQTHDISLNVEFPISNDSFMYWSKIKEFNAESQCLPHGCLARGIFGAIFIPLKKITYIANGSGFEIGCKRKDQINHLLLSKDLFAQINLDDLHLVDFILRVPELSLFFSPADVSMYSALGKISPKEPKHARDGRQLWKLAASKVSHGTSAPRFSLHKLVIVARLWLHYVNAYEHILSLIGYPANHFLERFCTEISKDKMVLSSACYHWKLITDVEKELPAEAISQARRVARYRAASSVQCVKETNNESVVDNHFKIISKILHLLAFILKLICNMLLVVVKLLCLRKVLAQEPKDDGHCGPISEDPYSRSCFILNLGKILITICQMEEIQPSVNEKLKSHIGISYSNLLSFSLSIDEVLLVYGRKTCEQSFFLSCGQLKINSSSSMGASLRKVKSKNHSSFVKQHRKPKEGVNNLSVLWSEPAQKFFLPETSHSGSGAADEATCRPILENFLEEMWLSWERACVKFEESHIAYSENPSLLCEIKNFLTYSGSLKCSLILGKLNLALEYSSILSIYLLLRHTQGVLSWAKDCGKARILSDSSRSVDEQPEIRMDSKYKYNGSRLKTALLKVLPEKNVELGILITGPHIRMSLRKEFDDMNKNMSHTVNHDDFHFAFDVHNIEVAVWPTSRTDLASLVGPQGSEEAEKKCLLFKEPHIIDVPKSNNEKYVSHGCISLVSYLQFNGLNAYVEDSVKLQQSQILESKPMTLQLSSFRECVHTFGTAIVAFSAALCGSAMGFSVLSYMDELYVLFQVVGSLSSAVSDLYSSFDLIGPAAQEYIRQEFVLAEPEKADIAVKGAPLIYDSILFRIHGTFKLKSVDMVIHVSRMSDNVESSMRLFDALTRRKFAETGLSGCGIWLSVKQTSVEILGKEQVEVLTDLSGVQSVIFRYQNERGKLTDHPVLKDLLLQSLNCLYEVSLSNCIITLWLAPPPEIASSSYSLSNMVESSSMKIDSERPTHWLVINVELGEISMARSSQKNVLVGLHQLIKLQSSLSVGGEFQTISWRSQGGIIFLETTALAMFTRCFASYLHCATHLFSLTQSSAEHKEKSLRDVSGTQPNDNSVKEHAQKTLYASLQAKKQLIEAFLIDVSQFSLVLVVEDESSGVREFILEVDMKFELANMRRKFKFDLSRLSILSQVLHDSLEKQMQIPHFSSGTLSGDSAIGFQHKNEIHSVNEASCSSDPVPQNEVLVKNCESKVFHSSHQNQILKQLCASMAVEKQDNVPLHLNQVWVGSGLVSGFDLTISLSEIQMILSTFSSFSGLFGMKMTSKSNERHGSSSHELENSMEEMVPNGAIVAIQDVHQHMYFTVESGENKYSLVGAVHYSLVGERALFRVNYHHQRIWMSQVVWFSLISLHAKNDLGEPLRLNYSPGSGFVDISSTNDRSWALWRLLSCEPKSYKGDIDWEPYNQLVKRTFYLVNKKNDCAVAFVNGIPEFVRKPGNPFKLKVFHHLSLARNTVKLDSHPVEAPQTSLQHDAHLGEEKASGLSNNPPRIDIRIDKISLTVVHELLDTKDRFPLLCGCISNVNLILQVLSTKTRVISTSSTAVYYFDAQRSLWRELLYPVAICIFYRSSSQIQDSEALSHGVPVHIYCRFSELNISLTELSLDMLLFVIGKLELAGPYSVKSSMILANCCKVENQSGLNLLCQFYNEQSLSIARNQSASVFLRNSGIANQSPEIKSVVSLQLANLGSLKTSPIRISLLEAQALACRTRIMSVEDSKTYPGPFLVVDISRKSEDGLSIVVSSLTRIHNETGFAMELRFQRREHNDNEIASALLKSGETIDDSVAMFDAVSLSGGLKKALVSISVGNFLFSFRPEFSDGSTNSKDSLSVEWSDDLEGGKAVRLSGILGQLSYRVRKALFVGSAKCSFSTACCVLKSNGSDVASIHFLIQRIGRDVPVVSSDTFRDGFKNRDLPVALREQKEIFLLPTIQVSNLLHTEIYVVLSETDLCTTRGYENIGKEATISCGSTCDLYANPAIIFFTVTLTAFDTSCKPVNSGDWVKKLQKQKIDAHHLDIDLDFGGGKYRATLRLSRGDRGILEAAIFTSYALKNDTDFSLYFFPPDKKPLSRDEAGKSGSNIPLELGLLVPPKSIKSWLLKSNKVQLKLLEDCASESLLDLDALSGLTEISLEVEEGSGVKSTTKLGVSMGPLSSKVDLPSQYVTMVPRYVVLNESDESITVRQCHLQDDMTGMICVSSKQRITLQLRNGVSKGTEFSLFENFIRKHRNANDDLLLYIQFQLNDSELNWSGPVCIASLGRFFLKFRKNKSNQSTAAAVHITEFAAVHVVEEGSSLVLHFKKPPDVSLPYRIENCLQDVAITYYQKESIETEILEPSRSVNYVWDDLTLPHKLVVQISDSVVREINLDKVRPWKPFYKFRQQRGLASNLFFNKSSGDQRNNFGEFNGVETVEVGYEVYADGPTRVLRISISGSHKGEAVFQSCTKIQLRVSHFAIHLLERGKQDGDESELPVYSPIIIARLGNINLDSAFTDRYKYNQISLQSLSLEEKWVGAPFAAMLRRHQLDDSNPNDCVLRVDFVLLSASSNVIQVKYSSIVLQPVDLNLDEETLMRIVPFWRTSLSDSTSHSRQFYFDHFEIHPIKIFANFLPGESFSSYSSAQETLRSLLHSVVKVPPIKNKVVELNGVLVTHALITMRELCIRCAQHYSWYVMRAIYIAKGSPLLPPGFVSIFDDLSSSSLDVFFDPSRGLTNLPGLTLGTFKLIRKCIDGKGFSGTKRYFGDLEKTLRTAGSNVLFAAVTEISDSVLRGSETSGFNGMVSGFRQGILKLAMEPSFLGTALMEGGPDRKIKLDHSPGVDELYIEGYLQAMLDTLYRQEYLRVRVIDNQVFLKNLPPNSSLIEEIVDRVKAFLMSKALLKGDSSTTSHPLHHIRREREWKIGPTVLTLCEHLFVSFAIRMLRKQANKFMANIKWKRESDGDNHKEIVPASPTEDDPQKVKFLWKWEVGKFVLSGMLAYIDGRLCRGIPNPVARRIVSGFLLSFLDKQEQ